MKTQSEASTRRALIEENKTLRARLLELEETLRAIHCGQVDALFVIGEHKEHVLTLDGIESAHRILVEAMNEGAAILKEEGIVLYCNGRLSAMLKAPLERVMGNSLFGFIASQDREQIALLVERARRESCSMDTTFCCQDGSIEPVQLSLSPMYTHGSSGVCAVATDLTLRNQARDELRNLSLIDELTELSNRRGFLTLAQQQLNLARRLNTEALLVFADMDGFKAINDSLGHSAGDQALIDIANVLRQTYRESDVIARLGGDEFAVLAMSTSEVNHAAIVERLQAKLDACNRGMERQYQLSMSIGVVGCGPCDPSSIGDLLALADAAMYVQKRSKGRSDHRDSSHDRTELLVRAPSPAL
ncbi:hypothetical protein ACPOL_1318 [Acidisarcina polymorpha]|uniref:Uncharacterized protein n=1 Tax=Acidisarcina polymorpha TaxID=2211140 RepID=A0A2Z5FW73_9BACT|nr:sensor domain-containing diguanylate cyclase [Acidisarcina polymorpha]AXC10666.1 hypothetical protein ACPOL_1318 [Acidisarcina polymorpha]